VKYFVGKKYVHTSKDLANLPQAPEGQPARVSGGKKGEAAPAAGGSDSEASRLIASAEAELAKQKALIDQNKITEVDFGNILSDYEAAKTKAQTDAVRGQAERGISRFRELNSIIMSARAAIAANDKRRADELASKEEARKSATPVTQFQGYVDTTGILFKRPGTHKLVMGGRIICFLRCKEGDEKMMGLFNNNYMKFVGINGTVIKNPEGWDGYSVVVVDEVVPIQKD
jgi:hypothetical protein